MKQMKYRQRAILQDVLIVLFAAAALFGALLTVLSLIPEPAGLTVRERVTVSSARMNSEERTYHVEARGTLRNTSDRTISVSRVTVTVGRNSGTVVLELTEPFTLPPRTDYDLMLSAEAELSVSGTPDVTAVVDGETVNLRNPSEAPLATTLLPIAVTILFGVLAWRAVRVRHYLAEEQHLQKST